MGLLSGKKEHLILKSCEVDEGSGKVSVDGKKKFEVMINPASFDFSESVCYNKDKSFGQAAQTPRFGAVGSKKVSFEIILDGTGVFNTSFFGVSVKSVSKQVKKLKKLVSAYDGSKHAPNVVQLVWGTFLFNGCLDSMSETVTLFKASGDPLRAKIKMSFTEYKTPQEVSREANMTSPDLTHLVEVIDGDTLPLLCNKFYKDSSYYLQVAKINGLTGFRNLTPGMKLKFPPLR